MDLFPYRSADNNNLRTGTITVPNLRKPLWKLNYLQDRKYIVNSVHESLPHVLYILEDFLKTWWMFVGYLWTCGKIPKQVQSFFPKI